MFKLLIVDDEFNIRDGFSKAVNWANYNVEVSGVAISGMDTLEKIKESKPDIVITDIYMDNMDGLELAEKIKEKHPEIKVIIVSGYDDFEYAKKAIDLKVFSYILKPVLPRQLIEAVCGAINEIEADRRLKNKMDLLEEKVKENYSQIFDNFLNDLVSGRISGQDELLQMEEFLCVNFDMPVYYCVIFNIDGFREITEAYSPKETYLFMLGIKEIVDEILSIRYVPYTILQTPGMAISVIGSDKNNNTDEEPLYGSLEKIKDNIKSFFSQTVTIGIGGYTQNILEIGKNLRAAEKALDYRIIVGKDSIIHIDDVTSMDWDSYNYPSEKEGKIIKNINLGDRDNVEYAITDFFKELASQNYSKEGIRAAVLQLFAAVSGKLMDKGLSVYRLYDKDVIDPIAALDRFKTVDEIRNWMANIVIYAIDHMHQNMKTKAKTVIGKAQDFIRQNSADPDISLVAIAKHVYMNPSYFSKMYKEDTGEAYIEFLTNLRIENAKRLLKGSHMKISDIVSSVGYRNTNYFCTLFKKYTGFSPMEYRGQSI